VCAALLASSCSPDDATIIALPPEGSETANETIPDLAGDGPVYAIAAELETPEGDVLYLDTTPDLLAPFDPIATGIELPNASSFKHLGEQVFVGQADAPTIARFLLDASGRLTPAETVSFAAVGVSSARDYALISATKSYLFDRAAAVVHVWNPSTMELSGIEIDFSAAFHEQYGSILIFPQFGLMRGDQLLVPGGWVGKDGVYARSLVLAFDTQSDEVEILEDERCTMLIAPVAASNGDVYFFPEANALVTSPLQSCALVIRQGTSAFDMTYHLNLETALDGRLVFDAHPGPLGTAYLMVPDEARIQAANREEVRVNARNDMRLWHMDLARESAEEVTSVPHFSRIRFHFDIGDGRTLINVERLGASAPAGVAANDVDVSAIVPTLYDLSSDEPVMFPIGIESNEVRARIAEIARLR
jgi:hypothetical protein